MKTQHTPGPWLSDWRGGSRRVFSNETTIAWLDFWQTPDFDAHKPSQEIEANAHLIASAPELAEALRGCITLLETAYSECKTGSDIWRKYPRVWNEARAVLTKLEESK